MKFVTFVFINGPILVELTMMTVCVSMGKKVKEWKT